MKLPALWIATAFAAGIALSVEWPGALQLWLVGAVIVIVGAGLFAWRGRVTAAWALALLAWFAVGALALNASRAAVPADHVSRLIAAGHIAVNEPLRWQGRLREDPMAMPWGRRYVIDLDKVESGGIELPVSGGLRLNLYDGSDVDAAPAGLRAGDRVEALVKARRPRDFLDPGAFDFAGYLARQKIDLTGSLRNGRLLRLIGRPPPTLFDRLARARGDLLRRLDGLFLGQPRRAAVLRAMLLGDRSFVDSRVVNAFQRTGSYHVLVVAGLHVGAIAIFLFWICRRLRLSIGMTSLVTLAALAAYVGVVQDRPPILRAALMAALYLCARMLFRRVDLLNTVALAALVLLVWQPSSLVDSSFQLSFLAAAVIGGLAVPWMERSSARYRNGLRHLGDETRDGAHPPKVVQFRMDLRAATDWLSARLPKRLAPHARKFVTAPVRVGLRLWELVLLSAVVQWGMMPLLAQDFHRVALAGPVSNIPAVLLTTVIVPLGFITLVATFLWTRFAMILARVLGFCTKLLLATVEWFSRIPRVAYRIPGPPLWLSIAFLGGLIALAAAARAAAVRQRSRRARRQMAPPIRLAEWGAAAVVAILTILVATYPFAPNLAHGKLEVDVLDVGQGDSIFTAFPNGRTMLVDGGGLAGSEWIGGYRSGIDVGEDVVSPYLWSRGLKRLDVVALTHADHDHIGGLYSVLENFRVGQLWVGRDDPRPAFKRLLAEARSRGVTIIHQKEGGEFTWGGAKGEVLWPPEFGSVDRTPNDNSLVLRLSEGREHFLLTGDIERPVEKRLVEEDAPVQADFLKVPHHGSKTSSTQEFLAAIAPRVAVISVGQDNPFGQPAKEVVARYERDGVRVLQTDRDGEVSGITDGKQLLVRSYIDR